MARKCVSARLNGDDYQARYFWYLAAQLLFPDSIVEKVCIEYDQATHVDDVTVFYKPKKKMSKGKYIEAHFFQIKYHVDYRGSYSADNFINPSFISSKTSLLQRFFKAYSKLEKEYSEFTLNLVSNWIWKDEDKLARSIRSSGELPDAFFDSSDRSELGKIRISWLNHLGIDSDTFFDFSRRLRLKLNYFGNDDLEIALADRLARAGLKPINSATLVSPYDDLARKLIQNGMTDLDKHTLLELCKKEGLVCGVPYRRETRTLGIRSFERFAENIANEADDFVSVTELFDGRKARFKDSWGRASIEIEKFIKSVSKRHSSIDQKVILDCHSSLAVLSGYIATSRSRLYPAGPRPGNVLCKPGTNNHLHTSALWEERISIMEDNATYLAVAVSVTHQIEKQVLNYLNKEWDDLYGLLTLEPIDGVGYSSVKDANHGKDLADALVKIVRKYKQNDQKILLFISAPNYLSFFIGQQSRALGELVLFEYDFENIDNKTYGESIRIPL